MKKDIFTQALEHNSTVSCSVFDSLPSARHLMRHIYWSDVEAGMVLVCLSFTVIIFLISVDVSMVQARAINQFEKTLLTGWQLTIYWVVALCSFVAMLVPRAADSLDHLVSFYVSVCQHQLLRLFLRSYLADRSCWKMTMSSVASIDKLYPRLRSLRFIGKQSVHIWGLRILVVQSPLIHGILLVTLEVLEADGIVEGDHRVAIVTPLHTVLLISKLFGMLGVSTANRMFPTEVRKLYKTDEKLLLLYPIILCCDLQLIFIRVLVASDVIGCNPALLIGSYGRGSHIHHLCLIFELLLLAIVARFSVWKYKPSKENCDQNQQFLQDNETVFGISISPDRANTSEVLQLVQRGSPSSSIAQGVVHQSETKTQVTSSFSQAQSAEGTDVAVSPTNAPSSPLAQTHTLVTNETDSRAGQVLSPIKDTTHFTTTVV